MNLSFFPTRPPTAPAFPFYYARRCCNCHLIWDSRISQQCPAHHLASIALPELLREKNEQIIKLQQMVRKLLRMVGMKDVIIQAASRRLRAPLVPQPDLPPAA